MKCINCVRKEEGKVRPFITAHIKFCNKCGCDTAHCFVRDIIKGRK